MERVCQNCSRTFTEAPHAFISPLCARTYSRDNTGGGQFGHLRPEEFVAFRTGDTGRRPWYRPRRCGSCGTCRGTRVSCSVGSEHLSHKEISERVETTAASLMDISIKLDRFRHPPKNVIIDLSDALGNYLLASTLLRRMARDYRSRYPTNYKIRHALCEQLDIASKHAEIIESKSKHTKQLTKRARPRPRHTAR